MAKQLYWEDVDVGTEVTPLQKVANTQKLVMWAGASGDFNPLHYDDVFAASQGVERPIVHGALKRSWLLHMMTNWIGEEGKLKKFSCQYRGIDYPNRMVTMVSDDGSGMWLCKGKVTQKYVEAGEHMADCEIWIENNKGEKTTIGKATVVLPSKS